MTSFLLFLVAGVSLNAGALLTKKVWDKAAMMVFALFCFLVAYAIILRGGVQ